MAIPANLTGSAQIVTTTLEAARGRIDDVLHARWTDDADADQPLSPLLAATVEAVDAALGAADHLTLELERHLEANPNDRADVRACESALFLLQTALMNDVALLQPLERHEGETIKAVDVVLPRYSTAISSLEPGPDGFDILLAGADDAREEPWDRAAPAGHYPYQEEEATQTVQVLVEQAGRAVTRTVGCLTLGHLAGLVPHQVPAWIGQSVAGVVEDPFDDALDALAGCITKAIRKILRKIKELIGKVLGRESEPALAEAASALAGCDADQLSVEGFTAQVLARVFQANQICADARAALEGRNQMARILCTRRLRKLRATNKRWVGPVENLANGLGPLWGVPWTRGARGN